MLKFIFIFLLHSFSAKSALEISKIEHPGCPENSFCRRETGATRSNWLAKLDELNSGKLTEKKFNDEFFQNQGFPISAWAKEEASIMPNIMMWDSPCKQHNTEALKYYIVDYYIKSLSADELKNYPNLFFSKAYSVDKEKKMFSIPIPRNEFPMYIENNQLHFLREDDGKYYELSIHRNGKLSVGKITEKTLPKRKPMRDIVCTKEIVDHFLREAPSPNFFQEYDCKEIWDTTSNTYQSFLFGRSCS